MGMRELVHATAIATLLFAAACSQEQSAEAVAEDLADNVERSAEIEKDTYDEARERGEGAVQAAGEAYEAVLEVPDEEEQQKSP